MRLLSIDILRTAAIGMMVLVHFVENLSSHYGLSSAGPASREHLWWLPVGLAAPLFTLLAGVSYQAWLTVQRDR
ncbi:MAG: heparan-alpha-glucosaminide N-acetyltransferase domain-containing protein, partial [Pirellulales bacterium]